MHAPSSFGSSSLSGADKWLAKWLNGQWANVTANCSGFFLFFLDPLPKKSVFFWLGKKCACEIKSVAESAFTWGLRWSDVNGQYFDMAK